MRVKQDRWYEAKGLLEAAVRVSERTTCIGDNHIIYLYVSLSRGSYASWRSDIQTAIIGLDPLHGDRDSGCRAVEDDGASQGYEKAAVYKDCWSRWSYLNILVKDLAYRFGEWTEYIFLAARAVMSLGSKLCRVST